MMHFYYLLRYIACEEFETFQTPSMSILDYINEFERRNNSSLGHKWQINYGNNSIKALFVARDFEEGEDSPIRRDWQICTKESLRLTLVTDF